MICCGSCGGNGSRSALIKTEDGELIVSVICSRCKGAGEVDPVKEAWKRIGGTHRTWRVAQHEGIAACAERLGLDDRDLDEMERGERDPSPLLANIPEVLRTYENLPQPEAA